MTDPHHLVTEQLYRQGPLRDVFAYAEPHVTEVRVETTVGNMPPFGLLDDSLPIEYEGQTYRVSTNVGPE